MVVGDVEAATPADADAVGRAQAVGDSSIFTGLVVNGNHPATILVLRARAASARIDRGSEGGIERVAPVHQAKRELVEVRRNAPAVGQCVVAVGNVVPIPVHELGQFLLLQDVDFTIDDLEAKGFGKAGGDALDRWFAHRAPDVVHDVNAADFIPRADDHAPVGEEVNAAHAGLKARDVNGLQSPGRVHAFQRAAVARAVALPVQEDALGAGGRHADFAALGGENFRRNDAPFGIARLLPFQAEGRVGLVLKEFDEERDFAGAQVQVARFGFAGAMQAVVVNHEFIA